MSTTLTISLYSPNPNSLAVFEATIPALLEQGADPALRVCRDWILNVVTEHKGELHLTQAIKELAPEDGLNIDITLPLRTGVHIRINVWHYGPKYHLGWPVWRGGPIQITYSLSDLELDQETREHPSKKAQYAAVLTGAMEMFDLVCGLAGSCAPDMPFDHGNLSIEAGSAVALISSIQYHRNLRDFVLDLVLARHHYEQGLNIPAYYATRQIGASSDPKKPITPLKDAHEQCFTQLDIHKTGETEAFFKGLASAPLTALTQLSETDLLPILELAAQDVPHILFRLHPQGGASIATHPEQGLWPFYASVLEVAHTLGI